MTHSASKPGSFNSAEYFTTGKALSAFLLIPLLIALVAEELVLESEDSNSLKLLNAHLITKFNTIVQITVHTRTERTIRTFLSKLLSLEKREG